MVASRWESAITTRTRGVDEENGDYRDIYHEVVYFKPNPELVH